MKIILLKPSQVSRAAKIMADSFGPEDPLNRFLWPDGRQKGRWWLNEAILRYCVRYGKVITDKNLRGVAAWLPPDEPYFRFWRLARAGFWMAPLKLGWKTCRRLSAFARVEKDFHKRAIHEPHWFLYILAVRPKHRGKGIGKALAGSMFAESDRTAVPCYVETARKQNLAYYERLGFKRVGSSGKTENGLPLWGLIRQPNQ